MTHMNHRDRHQRAVNRVSRAVRAHFNRDTRRDATTENARLAVRVAQARAHMAAVMASAGDSR